MLCPRTPGEQSATLVLTHKGRDLPISIGANIIGVAITLDWVLETANVLNPISRAVPRIPLGRRRA